MTWCFVPKLNIIAGGLSGIGLLRAWQYDFKLPHGFMHAVLACLCGLLKWLAKKPFISG